MKIGILTLPLNINYGGILQVYALQTVLQRMGHDVKLIKSDRFPSYAPKRFSLKRRCVVYPKRFLCKYLLGKRIKVCPDLDIIKKYNFEAQNILPFIKDNFKYISLESIRKFGKDSVECIVVGSDQVWRREYAQDAIVDYFLKWLDDNNTIKRIAYAASFGSDNIEFTESELRECKDLVKKFEAITVREDSGVNLCRDYLNIDAQHVLDPTMLLCKDDYISLVNKYKTRKSQGNLFYYILDKSDDKFTIINHVAAKKELMPFTQMPLTDIRFFDDDFVFDKSCVYPALTAWLRSFMDAEFVITDSFHGSVFSIIFNKPFYVIGNKERGMGRFTSLLKLFNLESRMIDVKDLCNIDIDEEINWDNVNNVMKSYRSSSVSLLSKSLG